MLLTLNHNLPIQWTIIHTVSSILTTILYVRTSTLLNVTCTWGKIDWLNRQSMLPQVPT